MSELSPACARVFKSAAEAAAKRQTVADSLDFLTALRGEQKSAGYKLLRKSNLLEKPLPDRTDEGDGGFCSATLYRAFQRALFLSSARPLCGTNDFLAALLLDRDAPAGRWLEEGGLHPEACSSEACTDPFEPAPPRQNPIFVGVLMLLFAMLLLTLGLLLDNDVLSAAAPIYFVIALNTILISPPRWRRESLDISCCPRCGRESTLRAMFSWERGICQPCERALERIPTRNYLLFFGLTLLATGLVSGSWPALGNVLKNILLLLPLYTLCVVLHEGGHAVAAWMLGYRVLSFHVGHGGVWKQVRIGSLWLYLQRKLSGGLTLCLPYFERFVRVRWFLFAAAGPAANVLFFALSFPDWEHANLAREWVLAPNPQLTFCYLNALMAIGNLQVRDVKFDSTVTASDGKSMCRAWNAEVGSSKRLSQQLDLLASQVYRELGNPEAQLETVRAAHRHGIVDAELVMTEMALLVELNRSEEAMRMLHKLPISEEADNPELRAGVLNMWAWVYLKAGVPQPAEALAREAVMLLPHCPSVRETLGEVLIACGYWDEGAELLRSSVAQTYRAVGAAAGYEGLARLAALQGNEAEYLRYRELVVLLVGSTKLAERAEQEAEACLEAGFRMPEAAGTSAPLCGVTA